jgi:hypothetical protein
MGARFNVLKGDLFSEAVRSYYILTQDTFPECRHCGRLVGFRRMRDHLVSAGLDPLLPFGVATPPTGATA